MSDAKRGIDVTRGRAGSGPPRGALVRSVALPTEHGGWSFVLEPVLLGLLAAPSVAGLLFAVASLGGFLLHQPLKTAIKDRIAGRRAFRTVWAERFAALYAACAVLGLTGAVALGGWSFLPPLALVTILASVQFVWDARNRSRALVPELCGAAALGGIATCVAVLDGWTLAPAAGLWLVLAARSLPSIVYVRERLLLDRGKPIARGTTVGSHATAIVVVAAAAWLGVAPWASVAAMVLLLARAVHGLSAHRVGSRPAVVGVQEMAFGLLTVLLTAFG
jgi:hypothetical protein